MPVHCHAPTQQMECAINNHQLHGQRHTPKCVTSVLCVFVKSAQSQPILWALWGMKGKIPTCRPCSELVNPLPHTHKVNGTCQQQSSAPWMEAHTTMHHFCPVHFAKCAQNQLTCLVPCGLKWIHHDMRLMPQACEFTAVHHKANGTCQQQSSAP